MQQQTIKDFSVLFINKRLKIKKNNFSLDSIQKKTKMTAAKMNQFSYTFFSFRTSTGSNIILQLHSFRCMKYTAFDYLDDSFLIVKAFVIHKIQIKNDFEKKSEYTFSNLISHHMRKFNCYRQKFLHWPFQNVWFQSIKTFVDQ